jgi:hypothetical protein
VNYELERDFEGRGGGLIEVDRLSKHSVGETMENHERQKSV